MHLLKVVELNVRTKNSGLYRSQESSSKIQITGQSLAINFRENLVPQYTAHFIFHYTSETQHFPK